MYLLTRSELFISSAGDVVPSVDVGVLHSLRSILYEKC